MYSFNLCLPEEDKKSLNNVNFYKNENGDFDEFYKKMFGKWKKLEYKHNYIQFLFPIREMGMSSAQPLTKNEAEIFNKDEEMKKKLIKSYSLMLDFYGCKLINEENGKIERSDNYKDRYHNLNTSSHNYLRITRILKCLGINGLEHLKKPFIKHFLTECLFYKELKNIMNSLFKFWLPTLRNEIDLEEMENYAEKLSYKKVTRKWYVKEPRTWANIVFPDPRKNLQHPDGKTFYDRDDEIELNKKEFLNINEYYY